MVKSVFPLACAALCLAIVRDAPAHLVPGGWLLMEVGAGQAPGVAAMLRDAGAREASSRDDLAGIARAVGGRFG